MLSIETRSFLFNQWYKFEFGTEEHPSCILTNSEPVTVNPVDKIAQENQRLKAKLAALQLENESLKKDLLNAKKSTTNMNAYNAVCRDLERAQEDIEHLHARIIELKDSGRWKEQ